MYIPTIPKVNQYGQKKWFAILAHNFATELPVVVRQFPTGLVVMIILHICRGTIPENLRKYVHGEPSEFVDKKQLLALGSRLFMLLKLINLIVEQGFF